MTNFFRVTKDSKQITIITNYTLKQVQEYYAKKGMVVQVESCIPSKKEALSAVPLD